MRKTIIILFVGGIAFAVLNCNNPSRPAGKDGWLLGSADEKFDKLANQLRGFDVCMMELNYRYKEFYSAYKDSNYLYGQYQIEKIRDSITKAMERRPKRKASADWYLQQIIAPIEKEVKERKTISGDNFMLLQSGCKSCHAMEKVPFMPVKEE